MPLGSLGQTCLQQVHVQQTTLHQKPFPHGEHPFSSVLCQGVCYGLSFHEGKLKFVHFGASYTNIPATSHSRDSHGWEDRRGPRSED